MFAYPRQIVTFVALCWALIGSAWAELDGGAIKIVASSYPLAYFAERIGGGRAKVVMPVPPDEDPAFWKPDAKAIGQLQQSDLIVLNGADHEKWLVHVTLPKLKQVDTSAGFKDALIRIENAITHSHGAGGVHSHGVVAYTTWLDFELAARQADALAQAMMRKRPEFKSLFQDNLKTLQADLAGLDADMRRIGADLAAAPLLGSHPVYQYLARRYGLNLQSVHWEPGEMPTANEWDGLRQLLTTHPAKFMLWEAQPAPEIEASLNALKIVPVVFDPAANPTAIGDFLAIMRQNLTNLRAARQL